MFVGDIVAANLAAAAAPALRHDTFNVGTGLEVSVLELIAAVAEAAGSRPGAFAPALPPGPAPVRCCAAASTSGGLERSWALPDPAPLTTGLSDTLDWMPARR